MRNLLLISAFFLGFLFPKCAEYSFLIRYLLMVMLFFAFLRVRMSKKIVVSHVCYVWIISLILGISGYLLFIRWNENLALMALILGICPTATAAPVIIDFLGGKLEYTIAAVFFTNIATAIIFPFLFHILGIQIEGASTFYLLVSMLSLIFIPLVLAQIVAFFWDKGKNYILKYKGIAFYAWVVTIFLAVSKATAYIQNEFKDVPLSLLITALCIAFLYVAMQFFIGYHIGGEHHKIEARQSLGHKNTMFAVWLSFTFLNPIVGLAPIFYIFFQNSFNVYLLSKKSSNIKKIK
jgi:BASS family bile acid:Na+ symporter